MSLRSQKPRVENVPKTSFKLRFPFFSRPPPRIFFPARRSSTFYVTPRQSVRESLLSRARPSRHKCPALYTIAPWMKAPPRDPRPAAQAFFSLIGEEDLPVSYSSFRTRFASDPPPGPPPAISRRALLLFSRRCRCPSCIFFFLCDVASKGLL